MENIREGNTAGNYKSILYGSKKNIYTFAIGTPENPMGKQYTAEENNKRRKVFEELLDKNRITYLKQTGSYGNTEKGYLIANINLDLCKYLFGKKKFDQESFIYGVVDPTADFRKVTFYYYEQDDNGKFVLRDKEDKLSDKNDADDYFTKYKNFKFSIPFSIFESMLNDISNKLEEKYGWDSNYREYLKHSALVEGKTLKHLWGYNCTHLFTEDQEKERAKRVKDGEKYLEDWTKKYGERVKLTEKLKDMMKSKE